MQSLGTYKNKSDEQFTLEYGPATTSQDANYWGFVVIATHTNWGQKVFKTLIQKNAVTDQQGAEQFLKADPVSYLKSILDRSTDASTPLFFRPLENGWALM